MIIDIDFETYSECDIKACGAAKYSEHKSTRIISLAYAMEGKLKLWTPQTPSLPNDLFNALKEGASIQAVNSLFEFFIWNNVGCRLYNFPELPIWQTRDVAAQARAYSIPGSLEKMSKVIDANIKKDKDGNRLIRALSIPNGKPKIDDLLKMYIYNLTDVKSQMACAEKLPELSEEEFYVWLLDQRINTRGVCVDVKSIQKLIKAYEEQLVKYDARIKDITRGQVTSVTQLPKLKKWAGVEKLGKADLDIHLTNPRLSDDVREVLELRKEASSASVKKLYAMQNMACSDNRVRGIFKYCGADRTGRFSGEAVQPQNLPSTKLTPEEMEQYIDNVQHITIDQITQCLRGMFIAAPGKKLICSDYSAIEAVVLAAVAREQWRLDVFKTHGKIYEMSAAAITGIPFQEFLDYKAKTGEHHPARSKIGKVAELASGYQGGPGAWKNFGADKFLTDEEIADGIKKWREASPNIVDFWKGVEMNAKYAIDTPGKPYDYNDIRYQVRDNILYCRLPSGRELKYHAPRFGLNKFSGQCIVFKGYNTNPKFGAIGWVDLDTYGGKLTENIVQAVSRDLLVHAMLNLEKAGYDIVLHVHDEIVSEVPNDFGSIKEFEQIMSECPPWAHGWPVKASGGWEGQRYRKG